ncbi:alpha/beta fold hydrolase [Haliangium sp.]|uniref:alpha/beta fold hydrolase n=1 Tax=Haliangium sp. TaxID=2663208 RepID=UPI003D0CF17C
MSSPAEPNRRMVELDDAELEVFDTGLADDHPIVCAAHPAEAFAAGTATLLAEVANTGVVCVNPRGLGASTACEQVSMEAMVDDIEAVRHRLGLDPWIFWGMSGGGWLAQLYAHRHPDGLRGIVVESVCLCFRERVADPACALSPRFAAWREPLAALGLLDEHAHADPDLGDDPEWLAVDGVGTVLRRRGGPALLVSPVPISAEMRAAMPAMWGFDSRPWIRDVHTPALVLAGADDPVVPVHRVRAVHEALAGSSFVLVDDAGHVPTSTRRPEVAAAFEAFLAANGLASG